MTLEIIKASKADQEIIQNLARFYIYDLSEFQKRKCPDNGLYEDEDYISFWTVKGHHPFLIKYESELAGFVLMEEGGSSEDIDYNIAEFFIIRKFRKQGLSKTVAIEIFNMYPGNWELMAISNNSPAIAFWEKTLESFTGGNYTRALEFHEVDMEVFRFSNK